MSIHLPRRRLLTLAAVLPFAVRPAGSVFAQGATPAAEDVSALLPEFAPLPEGEPRADGPLNVVATTPIIADLAREVGGPRVEVSSLLPPAADPHEFEPTPAELVAASEADLLLVHGLGLDSWSEQLLENAGPDLPVTVVTDGIPVLTGFEEEHDHEGEDHDQMATPDGGESATHEENHDAGGVDPHVWLDPERGIMMADNIARALIAIDPEGQPTYDARLAAYSEQLRALDAAIQQAIDSIPAEQRKLVTNHDAMGYYADRFGLEVVGSIIPSFETTAQPSASELAALQDLIAAQGIRAIFVDSSANPSMAETLAADTGVTVVTDLYTDTLGEPGSDGDTYYNQLRFDTIRIVEALR